MRRAPLLVVGLVGVAAIAFACGTLESSDPPPVSPADEAGALDHESPDGGRPQDAAPEGPTIAPPCDVTSPWGEPIAILKRDDLASGGATLTDDELTLYFDWDDAATGHSVIVKVTRMSRADGFPQAGMTISPPSNATSNNYQPALTPDATSIFFTSTRPAGVAGEHTFRSQLDGGAFGPPKPVGLGSGSGTGDFQPFATADELWFDTDRVGGDFDLYRAAILPDGGFISKGPANELNSPDTYDVSPVLTRDGLTIFFASSRDPSALLDIWTSTRPSKNDVFATPTQVVELASPGNDRPTWISADGCRLYLMSTRDPSNNQWVYVTTRTR